GRVPRLDLVTPPDIRHKKTFVEKVIRLGRTTVNVSGFVDHSIAWRKNSTKFAEQYNSAVVLLSRPCLRRWLEFIDEPLPKNLGYEYYPPPAIIPKPERIWTLYHAENPVATFTNLGEGYLIVRGFNVFGGDKDYHLIYHDY